MPFLYSSNRRGLNKDILHDKYVTNGSHAAHSLSQKSTEGQNEHISETDCDYVPLACLTTWQKERVKRKHWPLQGYDDKDNDKDYTPSQSSASGTDIETPVIIEKQRRKWWRKRNRPK